MALASPAPPRRPDAVGCSVSLVLAPGLPPQTPPPRPPPPSPLPLPPPSPLPLRSSSSPVSRRPAPPSFLSPSSRPRQASPAAAGSFSPQKLFRSREGDIISSPADVLQWIYNDGDTDYVSITLFDTKSFHNQLDRKVRSFFIAGKSQQSREYSRINGGNIFSGFDKEILREVFPGVNYETIHKIQAQDDERGSIVLAPDLQLQIPEESQQGEHGVNGVEESLCNLKFTHNLNNSSQSDYLDRCAGRINTVNGNALPILQFLRLSAAHVVLYKNAVLGPQWMVNAHSAVYVTKGDGRFSVVNDEGNAMFDDVVQKGQILVIPQGFAVAAKAGGEGLEWVEMRTNEDAVSSAVAGRNSVLGAIPAEVLANAFDISREQAVRLKNGSPEIGICRPFGESSEREQHDVV